MGADIYRDSVYEAADKKWSPKFHAACEKRRLASERGDDANQKKYQKLVDKYYVNMYPEDGYFRDSYNSTSVAWQMGMSYWGDIGKLLRKDGYMSVRGMKKWLKQIEATPIPPVNLLKLDNCDIDDKDNTREKWREYFVEKREKLIRFLTAAIKANEPIRCSF
jgi:hypothetical protein